VRASDFLIRAFIRNLGKTASDRGVPLKDLVFAAMSGKVTEAAKGKVLVSASANGTASTYEVSTSGVDASEVAILSEGILTKIEQMIKLEPGLSDAQLIVYLLDCYPSNNSMRPDFSVGLER
jgi:hypothetical protein